jgi:hypothetical protein
MAWASVKIDFLQKNWSHTAFGARDYPFSLPDGEFLCQWTQHLPL